MEKNKTITEELNELYKDYYILLESSFLGEKLDIIRCVREGYSWTSIIKANGDPHDFAANMKYGVEKGWFVPFSHSTYAKLHVEAALKSAAENVEMEKECGKKDDTDCHSVFCRNCLNVISKTSILNAYPSTNIK